MTGGKLGKGEKKDYEMQQRFGNRHQDSCWQILMF